MDICRRNRDLYELLRRLGEDTGNASQACNGRQCLWRIYSYFSLPGSITLGLKVIFAVLDLSAIKLVGGDDGLVRYWDTWSHCVKRIMDNPPRTTCEHLFVGEMGQAPVMRKHVQNYDDLNEGHIDETWEWIEKKGRACFERARQRDNRAQSQYGLSGRPSRQAIVDTALPGEQYMPPVGKGQGQAQSHDGNWRTVPLQKGQVNPSRTTATGQQHQRKMDRVELNRPMAIGLQCRSVRKG
jgi:hypothetical protein